jgi:cytochrome c biogenesis protein CcdA
MTELAPTLLPLLLVDILNPVLFAVMLMAVATPRPVANSSAMLLGHTVAYFCAGIVISLGLEQLMERLANPQPLDFGISLAVGFLCLWAALGSRDGGASQEKEPEFEFTPLTCFGFGAIVNFVGVPFAVPYFAALDQVLSANLSQQESLTVLGTYNLVYAIPFALVPILVAVMGDRSKPVLERINRFMVAATDKLMPILLLLIGLALTADSIYFFATGDGLV